jgi:hypothetical protein
MKLKTCQLLVISLLILSACKKDPPAVTKPVEFKETTYKSLGTYDTSGVPNYLLPKDTISPAMISYIKTNLPEKTDLRTTNPDLLTTKAIADIAITQPSDVLITFVSQRTSITNAIAFYTYPTTTPPASAKDIREITYVFPNAGMNTKLQAGDKVKIGRFNAGTSVGFVLLRDGWDATSKTLNNQAVHFCSNDVLNPEVDPNLKKHAVLINYTAENKVLIGFENTDRTSPICDHDFNDVVIYATVTP